MTDEEFGNTFWHKQVTFVSPTLTITGLCTAALKREEYILAIMAEGYELGKTPEKWITFKCPLDDVSFSNWITQFTVES